MAQEEVRGVVEAVHNDYPSIVHRIERCTGVSISNVLGACPRSPSVIQQASASMRQRLTGFALLHDFTNAPQPRLASLIAAESPALHLRVRGRHLQYARFLPSSSRFTVFHFFSVFSVV
jgi:hypothetical protein